MARIEELIKDIPDQKLREDLAREVAQLKAEKKFGLVFEEHLPEILQLPSLPIVKGTRVCKRNSARESFVVLDIGKTVRIRNESTHDEEEVEKKEIVAIKRFGEPIYPTLIPVERVSRTSGKADHAIINADNYHALQLLQYCYAGQVDAIYIDPPYNTGARDWKYNNDYVDKTDMFRHSKWLAMMKRRLLLAKRLLKPEGVLVVTIDDNEVHNLRCLLGEVYPSCKFFTVVIEHNKRGRRGEEFAKTHEYALFVVPQLKGVIAEEEIPGLAGGETRNLRQTGNNSLREARPKQFYPIYVNPDTLEIVDVGDPLPADEKRKDKTERGMLPIWPLDKQGVERNWHYGNQRMKDELNAGKIFAARQDYGIQIYYTLRERTSKRFKTVWSRPALDASTYGSEMLTSIFGRAVDFAFPKSLYAVLACLSPVVGHRKDALILDFFAGSGTTLHATALLNSGDGGTRRCILVTNNEVGKSLVQELADQGRLPGDREFEKNGICESVTFPRCKYVVNGKRDDGSELEGEYLDGRPMKTGFEENIQYFKLDFLDPNEVAYGDQFGAIVPILWMIAGGFGKLERPKVAEKWFIPKESHYAVLIEEEYFSAFKREVRNRNDITDIFLVTDSEEAYRQMISDLPGNPKTRMLYKSYLDNFKINAEKDLK